jgi:hypothetical protein
MDDLFEFGSELDQSGEDFDSGIDFLPPTVDEALDALTESRVARMELMIHGDDEWRDVDVCDVRPIRGIRPTSRWRRQAVRHRFLVADAVYAEMQKLFVLPDQPFKEFVAKVTVAAASGEVKVSSVRFLEPTFAFTGWTNNAVVRRAAPRFRGRRNARP